MTLSPDRDRNSLAQSYLSASRVSTIAMSAVVPAGLGYWLDSMLGTSPWLLITGAGLGFTLMLRDLIQLTATPSRRNKHGQDTADNVAKDKD